MHMQAFICVGILLAYLVGLPYQHNEPQHVVVGSEAVSWWRVMFLFGIAPAVLQVETKAPRQYVLNAVKPLLYIFLHTSVPHCIGSHRMSCL